MLFLAYHDRWHGITNFVRKQSTNGQLRIRDMSDDKQLGYRPFHLS